jgi:transglutaminase-like putative cysteine protease
LARFVREQVVLEVEPRPIGVKASEVLCFRRGSAFGKAILFVALCRGAGLTCRIRFQHLSGAPSQWLSAGELPRLEWEGAHPLAEVEVEGKWVAVDVSLDSRSASRAGLKMPVANGTSDSTLAEAVPWDGQSVVVKEPAKATEELLVELIRLTTLSIDAHV